VLILIWNAYAIGGTIRTTLNLAGYLAHEHDVEIVSVVRKADRPFFAFPPGVTVSALVDRRPGATPPRLRRMRARLERLPSVFMHPAERSARDWNVWTDMMLARKLRRRTGFLMSTRPGLNLVSALVRPPGMITIGQEHLNLAAHPKAIREAIRHWYPRLDAVVALTNADFEHHDELLGDRVRVERIPNTVRPMGGSPADLDATVVMAAGRLRPQKGFDLLVRAYARVVVDHPDWELRIHGGGPERERLLALAKHEGIAENVTFPGLARELGVEMAKASVFVLSSRSEGFPLILIEAMSKGLAVVSFDCPTGPSDVIDDHRNGILVPAEDVDALARGIREMIDDPELRQRCGSAAAETARAYTMDAIGPQWTALLRDLARMRWAPRPLVRAREPTTKRGPHESST
jgi:glycosyltransferase involved in cell wall biosynthesis